MWYARKAAIEAGADVLALEYGYWVAHQTPDFDADTHRIVDEATTAIQQVLSQHAYTSLVFVSKSAGTCVAGQVARRIPDLPIRHLFLTPIRPAIPLMLEQGGALVVGGRDWALSQDEIAQLSQSLSVTVFPGAKHSLEVNGDVAGSLHILSQIAAMSANMVRRSDRAYINENNSERMRLKALVAGLSDDDLSCSVNARWTVGVTLMHLAFWDRLWLAKFEEWERTGTVQIPQMGEAVHGINDGMLPWWRMIAPAQVRYEVIAAAEAVDSKVATLPDPVVDAVMAVRPRTLTRAIHRREHLDKVEQALTAGRK